ncbi:MAG TPA: glycosyltransferase family 2 protein [Acetobacteraceae bacterium]|nr:glycosyltransferase family 2 protein [Acetobacteraceae bacterium]
MSRPVIPAPQARSLAGAPPPTPATKAPALGNFLRKAAFSSSLAPSPPTRTSLVPPVRGEIHAPARTKPLKVSIHVPVCSEPPQIVCETLDVLSRLDYPDFEVLVIDNNTDDPALWEPVAKHCAKLGSRFRFFHLGSWPGFRAGALNFALGETAANATIIGVISSGDIVSPDWLRSMVPAFADPKLGFAQSPQECRESEETLFKRLMFWEYTESSHLGMISRDGHDPIIAHAAMILVRTTAIHAAGGWAEWCPVEEAELGLRLMCLGWRGISARKSFGKGAMPDDFASWRRQHFCKAYGAIRIGEVHWRALLSPFSRELSLSQRWRFLIGGLAGLGEGLCLLLLLTALAWSVALILSPGHVAFPILLFLPASVALAIFRQAEPFLPHHRPISRSLRAEMGGAIARLARSHITGKATLWGLTAQPVPFFRMLRTGDAPWFAQGLAAAREESCLLLLAWAAVIGVAAVHGLAGGKVKLWCLTLLIQSLPYLAAVSLSLLAALPAPCGRTHAKTEKKVRNRR